MPSRYGCSPADMHCAGLGRPPDLLGRVNASIELLGVDREDFFKELLDDLTKELKPVQTQLRRKYEAKKTSLQLQSGALLIPCGG